MPEMETVINKTKGPFQAREACRQQREGRRRRGRRRDGQDSGTLMLVQVYAEESPRTYGTARAARRSRGSAAAQEHCRALVKTTRRRASCPRPFACCSVFRGSRSKRVIWNQPLCVVARRALSPLSQGSRPRAEHLRAQRVGKKSITRDLRARAWVPSPAARCLGAAHRTHYPASSRGCGSTAMSLRISAAAWGAAASGINNLQAAHRRD